MLAVSRNDNFGKGRSFKKWNKNKSQNLLRSYS